MTITQSALRVLYGEIQARSAQTVANHPGWPCREGCDSCCRHLADIPSVSRPEWELLNEGLASLPEATRQGIAERIRVLTPARPVVCPFLDSAAGTCLVYEYRPAACRTYGFYVERKEGLYCRKILNLVESGDCPEVVWGNMAGVEARLAENGLTRDIKTWFVQGAA